MRCDFIQAQEKYNNAFLKWQKKGYTQDCSEYKTIFNCIYSACQNVARAMLKGKVFIDDVTEKATDCTIHIMKKHELEKHIYIKSLGAYVRYPLMNYLWAKKVIQNDELFSYEIVIDTKTNFKPLTNKYDWKEKTLIQIDNEFYDIDDVKKYTDIKAPANEPITEKFIFKCDFLTWTTNNLQRRFFLLAIVYYGIYGADIPGDKQKLLTPYELLQWEKIKKDLDTQNKYFTKIRLSNLRQKRRRELERIARIQ